MPLLPTVHWSAICPKNHRHFYLGYFQGVYPEPYSEYVLTYPKDDMSEVIVVCPICGQHHTFKNEDLLRPSDVLDYERKEEAEDTAGRIKSLEARVKELESAKIALEKALNDQDAQIGKFADAYQRLVDYFILGKQGAKIPDKNPLAT